MEGTSSRSIRLIALFCLALLCAALIVSVAYWSGQRSCQSDAQATKGEIKRGPDGRMLYFDGQCWTDKPMPPKDTPF